MGCFSWVTQNSNRSIIMEGYGTRRYPSRTCYMWDNAGRRWREEQYEGYGMFGGKDYYVLLAEMNRAYGPEVTEEQKRNDGIAFEFSERLSLVYPNLTDCKEWTWKNEQPNRCINQGSSNHFYDGDDSSDDEDNDYESRRLKYSKIHKYDGWPNGEAKPGTNPVSRL